MRCPTGMSARLTLELVLPPLAKVENRGCGLIIVNAVVVDHGLFLDLFPLFARPVPGPARGSHSSFIAVTQILAAR